MTGTTNTLPPLPAADIIGPSGYLRAHSQNSLSAYGRECFEAGRQQGCTQTDALWELARDGQEMERTAETQADCQKCRGSRFVEEGDPDSGGNRVPCPDCFPQERTPEHGQLDPRTAYATGKRMKAYCESFNGQQFGGATESVDRKNLAVALENLEEASAMLMNMAERVPLGSVIYAGALIDAAPATAEQPAESTLSNSTELKPSATSPQVLTDEAIEWVWRMGWLHCRDSETVGREAQNEEWGFKGADVIAGAQRLAAATQAQPVAAEQPIKSGIRDSEIPGFDVDPMFVFEHDDGRYAVGPEGAAFAVGDPAWHRMGHVTVTAGAEDTARLDWLEMQVVNVRVPLIFGSRDLFWASPEQDDPAFPAEPSNIRQRIDKARKEQS